jgi:hypothetical protein
VLAGTATVLVIEHQLQATLREENESLRRQVTQLQAENEDLSNRMGRSKMRAPRLPAPPVQVSSVPQAAGIDDLRATNLYSRFKNGTPKLTADQAKIYLKENGRSAAALLAAFRTTGDPALLAEAMQKYPADPQVNFEAVFKKDLSPEERRRWLDSFKQSAPGNALADYLSAAEHLRSGRADEAVKDLISASGKEQFEDYTQDRIQNDEEAFLSAGYSVAEAKTASSMQLLLPQLLQMKELGLQTIDLARSYQQAGDEASGQAALQMVALLGQRYSHVTPGQPEISQLVGMALERMALGKMDPNSPYGSNGQTVQDRLNQLARQRESLDELNRQLEPLLPNLSDQDWIIYKDRWRLFGEEAGLRWVINKHGRK